MIKSKVYTHSNFGKQSICIVNEDMLPTCFYLSNHLNSTYADYAINTQRTYAGVLLFIYRYFGSVGIQLVERIESGEFLSREEFYDFIEHCNYKSSVDSNKSNIVSFYKYSDKELDNLIYATSKSEDRVSASTAKMRLKIFNKYCKYLYDIFHAFENNSLHIANKFDNLKESINSEITALKNQNNEVRDPFEELFPDTLYLTMLEKVQPHHSDNPWKSSRLRNLVLICLFIDTGIRKGAVAKLKISDLILDWDNPRILVTRTPNDPQDSRKYKAAQKTKPHSSAISKRTAELIELYIETDRKAFSKSSTHDFVFISEKGKTGGLPLSLKSIDYIFIKLSESIAFHVYPHLLRHKWNELFDKKACELGFSPEQIEDLRKYAMGWSENSKMASTYNEYRLAIKTQEISFSRQKEIVDGCEND